MKAFGPRQAVSLLDSVQIPVDRDSRIVVGRTPNPRDDALAVVDRERRPEGDFRPIRVFQATNVIEASRESRAVINGAEGRREAYLGCFRLVKSWL